MVKRGRTSIGLALLFGVSALAGAGCETKPAHPQPAPTDAEAVSAIQSSAAPSASTSASASAPSAVAISSAKLPDPRWDTVPRAIDMHVDTPWQVRYKGRDIALKEGQGAILIATPPVQGNEGNLPHHNAGRIGAAMTAFPV